MHCKLLKRMLSRRPRIWHFVDSCQKQTSNHRRLHATTYQKGCVQRGKEPPALYIVVRIESCVERVGLWWTNYELTKGDQLNL